jgi:long-chain acyl-CoA synthetase
VQPIERVSAAGSEAGQRRAAGAPAGAGLVPGDRVAVTAHPSPSLLTAVLGALRTGVVPVMVDPSLTPPEREGLLADADPALVLDGEPDLARLLDGPPHELAPVPLARPLHYTSGTTGRPRGVWSGVLDETDAVALAAEETDLWGFDAGDVHLVCAPLRHSAPLRFALGTLLAGGDVVVVPPPFVPAAFAAAVTAARPTTTFLTPTHLHRLLARDAAPPDLGSFRLVVHAGAPCPESLKRAALAAVPPGSLWEFYGATEGQFTACSPGEWAERPGTVGRAPTGRVLAVDDGGRVWCRPPRHARFEYWRDPTATDAAWREGAFTVGDLGRLDGDGYLFLLGRDDDVVVTGGVNVSPFEVEAVLSTVPGVVEVAVFGVPDERWGQRLCAAVVGEVDEAALRDRARARLAPAKRPKDVLLVAALPRSGLGKLRRAGLAAQLGLR